jgi:fibronectin-binding autotransporter adhesin
VRALNRRPLRCYRHHRITPLLLAAIPAVASANNDTWKNAATGIFTTGSNWTDGSSPMSSDSAAFNVAGSYDIVVVSNPTNINLTVGVGAGPRFLGGGTSRTYTLTGFASVAAGGTLTLGGQPVFPVTLVDAGDLGVDGAANVTSGYDVTAGSLSVGLTSGTTAAVNVTGAGSTLSTTGTTRVGDGGSSGTLTYQTGAGGLLAGEVHIADSGSSATRGTLQVLSGASVTAGGNIYAPFGSTTGRVAALTVDGGTLTQNAGTLFVGSSTGGSQSTVSVRNGGLLDVSNLQVSDTGVITVSTGATLNVRGATRIDQTSVHVDPGALATFGAHSSIDITGDSVLSIGDDLVAPQGSTMTFQFGGGTLSVGGTLDVSSGASLIGSSSSDISAGSLVVGRGSAGTIDVAGIPFKASSPTGRSVIGDGVGGNGHVEFAATGDVTFAGSLVIGSGGGHGSLSVSGSIDVVLGPTFVGADGVSGSVGSLSVGSFGSSLTLSAGADLTVGAASGSMGTVSISSNPFHTSTSGSTSVLKTGTFSISGSATFQPLHNVLIDGGLLTTSGTPAIMLPPGRSLTVQGGGTARLGGSITASNTTLTVSGVGSSVAPQPGGVLTLPLDQGTQATVAGGASLLATTITLADAAFVVDGPGSVLDVTLAGAQSNTSYVGNQGRGTLTVRNGGLAKFYDLTAGGVGPASVGVVNVFAGGTLQANVLRVGGTSGATTAMIAVSGPASSLTLPSLTASLTVGTSVSGPTGIIDLSGSALLDNLGTTTLYANGTIRLSNATARLGTLNNQGGSVDFQSGAFSFAGPLTIGSGGLLGPNLTLPASRSLDVNGVITIPAGQTLSVTGGSLTAADLSLVGKLVLNAGTVTLTVMTPASIRQFLLTNQITSTAPDSGDLLSVGYFTTGASTLLKLTYTGDTNLDGRINADDYAAIDRGRAKQLTTWQSGDFNYDGTINAQDYLLIDRVFLQQGAPVAPDFLAARESQFGPGYVSRLLTSVPEPALFFTQLPIVYPLLRRTRPLRRA